MRNTNGIQQCPLKRSLLLERDPRNYDILSITENYQENDQIIAPPNFQFLIQKFKVPQETKFIEILNRQSDMHQIGPLKIHKLSAPTEIHSDYATQIQNEPIRQISKFKLEAFDQIQSFESEESVIYYSLRDVLIKNGFESAMEQKQKQIVNKSIFNEISLNITFNRSNIDDNYKIQNLIGEGAFGNVYRAYEKNLREHRAVKIFKVDFIKGKIKKDTMTELIIHKELNHPNIIKYHDTFCKGNHYFLVTEYSKHGNLKQLMHENAKAHKKMSEKEVKNILKQVLSGLVYLHDKQILHRDLKPENIVYFKKQNEEEIQVKMIDFGCSVIMKKQRYYTDMLEGTVSYMSPQQLKGTYSLKCDLWSCGVIMFLLLTGKNPYEGHNIEQTAYKINTLTFKSIEAKLIRKKTSPHALNLLSKLLQKNQFHRLSAKEALDHSWINQRNKNSKIIDKIKTSQNLSSSLCQKMKQSKMNQSKDEHKLLNNKLRKKQENIKQLLKYLLHYKIQIGEESKKLIQIIDFFQKKYQVHLSKEISQHHLVKLEQITAEVFCNKKRWKHLLEVFNMKNYKNFGFQIKTIFAFKYFVHEWNKEKVRFTIQRQLMYFLRGELQQQNLNQYSTEEQKVQKSNEFRQEEKQIKVMIVENNFFKYVSEDKKEAAHLIKKVIKSILKEEIERKRKYK